MRNICLSTQIDDATGCSGNGHLTACVKYVADATINEDMFLLQAYKKKSNERTF
jgi:hypothetical protein